MNEQNLYRTLEVQTISKDETRMRKYIKRFVKGIKNTKIHYHANNIYITKGEADIYPCVVAHMDTVHKIYNGFKIYEAKGNLFAYDTDLMRQVGIGGDDKVGVFIALEMLREFDNIKIAFFSQEEIGCVGSGKAKMEFFDNCSFALQCDRNGNDDFIQNSYSVDLLGPAFLAHIKPFLDYYGYSETEGSLTDVVTLKENGLEIPCANMSCGYYDPHTAQEYVNIKDVENCWNLVHALIMNLGYEKHYHKNERVNQFNKYDYDYGHDYSNNGYWDSGLNKWIDSAPRVWDTKTQKWVYPAQKKLKVLIPDDEQSIIPFLTAIGYCNTCGDDIIEDDHRQPMCDTCNHYVGENEWTSFEDMDDTEEDDIECEIEDQRHTLLLPEHDGEIDKGAIIEALTKDEIQEVLAYKKPENGLVSGRIQTLIDKIKAVRIDELKKVI